jgi:hypothetical protein
MAKNTKSATTSSDPTAKELQAIKRLMILFMIRNGLNQDDIAKALEMDRSTVSKMFGGTGRKGSKPYKRIRG